MNLFQVIFAALVCGFINALRGRCVFANAVVPGTVTTHHGSVTRALEEAFASKHLLATQGTADDEVQICGANELPLGVVPTTGAADDRAELALLGAGPTRLMIASEAITAGEAVFTAAAGKVQDLPAGAGTYYQVGIALTAADGDGDEIEVLTCVARELVVEA